MLYDDNRAFSTKALYLCLYVAHCLDAYKLYPAGATTNSDSGVTDIEKLRAKGIFKKMAEVRNFFTNVFVGGSSVVVWASYRLTTDLRATDALVQTMPSSVVLVSDRVQSKFTWLSLHMFPINGVSTKGVYLLCSDFSTRNYCHHRWRAHFLCYRAHRKRIALFLIVETNTSTTFPVRLRYKYRNNCKTRITPSQSHVTRAIFCVTLRGALC